MIAVQNCARGYCFLNYFMTNQLSYYLVSPFTWIAFVFGAIFGSFMNVCIFRIPEKTFFQSTRSQCRSCGVQIPGYLNIPILSFVVLRGRAKCCGAKLSWQYPLVEFAAAVALPMLYWTFPFVSLGQGALTWDAANLARFTHATLFVYLMIICSVIDLRLMIIPDVISLPMIAVTPLVVFFPPGFTWPSSLIGVLLGGGSLYAIAWIYWLVRREVGMGMGDVKLLAAIGGWLGYQSILPTVFFASILGTFFGLTAVLVSRAGFKTAIPFGPFLALGAIIHLFWGPNLTGSLF